jgi:hypothetical protein
VQTLKQGKMKTFTEGEEMKQEKRLHEVFERELLI